MTTHLSNRVASVDVLRALTMTLMIFVNDLWSLTNIPSWLEHTAAADDGMGLADTVFPAFLFITGMSVPLSINNRRSKGDNNGQILWHIVSRSMALLIMGLFLVNGEYIDEAATGMKRGIWNILCCTCFIILWNNWPTKAKQTLIKVLKIAAAITLAYLFWIYRGNNQENRFTTHWWGILGLIGWGYFISAIVYTLSKGRFSGMVIAWLVFNLLTIASHAGWLHSLNLLQAIISPFEKGAMPALITGGILTTMIFQHYQKAGKTQQLIPVMSALAILLLVTGFYFRQFWGISKIRATPAWVFICSAITILMFLLIYWLVDKKGKINWFTIIKPAGTNTLLCYLVPYFVYAFMSLFHFSLPAFISNGAIGLLKSLSIALIIVSITGLLVKAGLRLKL